MVCELIYCMGYWSYWNFMLQIMFFSLSMLWGVTKKSIWDIQYILCVIVVGLLSCCDIDILCIVACKLQGESDSVERMHWYYASVYDVKCLIVFVVYD